MLVAAAMGQYLTRLAGSPYLDVAPPVGSSVQTTDPYTPPKRLLSIEGVNCVICQHTPREHHICCVNGHGDCIGCIMREKLRTALCPMCRLPMLTRLIPNLALNDAVAATETETTTPTPVSQAPVSQATPPSRRRQRDPEAERAAKLRRVQQLCEAAEVLRSGPLHNREE